MTATLVLFVGLLFLSAFFSGSETAVFSLDVLKRARIFRKNTPSSRRLKRLFERPQDLLMTILIGNMLVNIGLASVASELFGGQRILAVIVITMILLVFGEITPKNIAYVFNQRQALLNSRLLVIFSWLLAPLRKLLDVVTRPVLSKSGMAEERQVLLTVEEFRTAILSGRKAGILGEDESGLINNVLSFSLKEARHIMTPRTQIQALSVKTPLDKAIKFARDFGYSKIPVYKKNKDYIIGYLRVKDLLVYIRGVKKATGISHLVQPVFYIPEAKSISDFFMEFKISTSRLAVVVDEFGGTAGIITLDDLLEEILGQFLDEDEGAERHFWRNREGVYVFRGSIALEAFNQEMGMELGSQDYETLGGYVLQLAGDIPQPGETYEDEHLQYTIIRVEENHIREIEVRFK